MEPMRLTSWKSLFLACILAAGASCTAPGTNPLPVGGTFEAGRSPEKSSEKSSPEKSLPEKSLDDAMAPGSPEGTSAGPSSSFQPQLPSSAPGVSDAPSPKPTAVRAPTDVIVADNRGGGFPSGNRAPGVDIAGGFICLKATYVRLCKESSEQRFRINLFGMITNTNDDPKVCAFDGKRALRVIYPTGTGGPTSLRFVDVPVAAKGEVEAVFSPSQPEGMDYYLVAREQEEVSEERSCANNVCVDADLNGDADPGSCAVLTLAAICNGDDSTDTLARSVVEVFPHHMKPLAECSPLLIRKAAQKIQRETK